MPADQVGSVVEHDETAATQAVLSTSETTRLGELERVVAEGARAFVEVGHALFEIREQRLYRATHTTFQDYCRERWHLSRPEAYRAIDAARVVEVLTPIGDAPMNEGQARELAPLLAEGPSPGIASSRTARRALKPHARQRALLAEALDELVGSDPQRSRRAEASDLEQPVSLSIRLREAGQRRLVRWECSGHVACRT